MHLAYVQTWKNAQLVKPRHLAVVLGYNPCDGYWIVRWDEERSRYEENVPIEAREVDIACWTELPDTQVLHQRLLEHSFVPVEVVSKVR